MGRDSANSLAPGFRFHPTDEEIVRYYLKRKVSGKAFGFDPIGVVDIYKFEPWDLPSQSKLKSRDLEWYFFSGLDKKYGNGSKTNRATEKGYWKTTGKDRPVRQNSRIVGMKKTLVYHSGRAPRGTRTNWVMHEYRLVDEELVKAGIDQVGKDAFVLCRVFQKSGAGPKNGEHYGAPFLEEEWEDDEVAPVSGEGAVTDEVLVDEIDAYFETNDLEQNLDMGIASESAGLPLNFCYGESSTYRDHSEEVTEDQKPLISTAATFEPQEDQFLNVSEQHAVDSKPLIGEYNGEASHGGSHFNFSYALDELYLDAIDYPLVGDGSFLETNDLSNPIEADPDGVDMLEEYLTYLDADDDISKYISFDSPEFKSSEDFVPDQGPPSILQNVDEEVKVSTMASKQNFETPCSKGASSSKQNPEMSESISGNSDSLTKKASRLLDSIPAPPALASEFPPKDIALQLHSAAHSSRADHITAGMIRVTNITLRGNGMDWTLSKNGEFNFVISSDFSAVNSAALVPVSGLLSGKSAFLVSHCWFFLMLFSVLILSLSFKIGSFMYAGK